ncbi:VOC family protein [Nocardioides cynanchi]|uniref:VOC family protein n=1 Tax=Nocardioides cynanchi TaxID=2558918 RepID=UPI0012492ABE|nr:VOC family protein [Nocardioides cynanchi]
MSIQLNHTIVHVSDKDRAAEDLAAILGLAPPGTYGPFRVLELANGVSLDFADDHGDPDGQHYAFLVEETEFDAIRQRIVDRGLDFWADPFHRRPGVVNTNDGGRGLYWSDADGHNLEILTVPYGG